MIQENFSRRRYFVQRSLDHSEDSRFGSTWWKSTSKSKWKILKDSKLFFKKQIVYYTPTTEIRLKWHSPLSILGHCGNLHAVTLARNSLGPPRCVSLLWIPSPPLPATRGHITQSLPPWFCPKLSSPLSITTPLMPLPIPSSQKISTRPRLLFTVFIAHVASLMCCWLRSGLFLMLFLLFLPENYWKFPLLLILYCCLSFQGLLCS